MQLITVPESNLQLHYKKGGVGDDPHADEKLEEWEIVDNAIKEFVTIFEEITGNEFWAMGDRKEVWKEVTEILSNWHCSILPAFLIAQANWLIFKKIIYFRLVQMALCMLEHFALVDRMMELRWEKGGLALGSKQLQLCTATLNPRLLIL